MTQTPIELSGKDAYEFAETHLRKVNSRNWEIDFEDPKTGELWLMDFPHSEGHGGGPPRLRKLPRKTLSFERIHTELWTSWASLLRSYAAAHGLNSRHHAVVEVGADEITLRVASQWLRFTHEQMEDSDGNRSGFCLQEDGTVKINGIAEEMDIAAEALAREMMQRE